MMPIPVGAVSGSRVWVIWFDWTRACCAVRPQSLKSDKGFGFGDVIDWA